MPDCSHVDAVIASIVATEAHIRHEYSGDWDATLDTVHPDARYALAQPGYAKTIAGHAGVASHYYGIDGVVIPHASRIVAQIATDWYMFFENFPTRIDVATGEWCVSHTATLAPVEPPLIRGEMLWERDPGPAGNHDAGPQASTHSLQIHEFYLEALRGGDRETLAGLIDEDATWAERDYLAEGDERPILELHGRAAALDHARRWHAAFQPERVSVLNRLATAWYVFAEELWTVRRPDGRRQLRKAIIYPITPAGTIKGAFGWGTDPTPAGASADETAGRAFWERSAPDVIPDPLLRGRSD